MKYIKLKKFCIANKSKNKMKRKPNDWEKIFTNDTSNKGLISHNSTPKKIQFKKGQRT